MLNYKKIIEDNKQEFNDEGQLTDFLDNYADEKNTNLLELEDELTEYADGLVPIYYADIVDEWHKNGDAQGMTKEIGGEYDAQGDIYKMMMSDLFCWYEQQLREDYEHFNEVILTEEDN